MILHRIKTYAYIGAATCRLLVLSMAMMWLMPASSPTALAATSAGTIIVNDAIATYYEGDDQPYQTSVYSNFAQLLVIASRNFAIDKGPVEMAAPNSQATIPYFIENTGNSPLSLSLQVKNLPEDDLDLNQITLFHDSNNNGQIDAGEQPVEQIEDLPPGHRLSLLAQTHVPHDAQDGQKAKVRLLAKMLEGPDEAKTAMVDSELTVVEKEEFLVTLSADRACNDALVASEDFSLTLAMQNLHALSADEGYKKEIALDGLPAHGYLALVELDDFITLPALSMAPSLLSESGKLIFRLRGEEGFITRAKWDGKKPISEFALFVTPSEAEAKNKISARIVLQISKTYRQGGITKIKAHVGHKLASSQTYTSPEVCLTVNKKAPTPAKIRFLKKVGSRAITGKSTDEPEDSLIPVSRLALSKKPADGSWFDNDPHNEGLYIEITGDIPDDEELDKGEPLLLALQNAFIGDSLQIAMMETSPDSGMYLSVAPIYITAKERGDGAVCSKERPQACLIGMPPGTSLSARLGEEGISISFKSNLTVSVNGIIFDSVSSGPVSGAKVYFRDSSGALAQDPNNPGSTIPAQTTYSDGIYYIPELAAGSYYIEVEPPTGHLFPSKTAPSVHSASFDVGRYSYGRDGFENIQGLGVFTVNHGEIVDRVDIPLDPSSVINALSISKSASDQIAAVADIVWYDIDIQNNTGNTLNDLVLVDNAARGFRYIPNSLTIDGDRATPTFDSSGKLEYSLGTINNEQKFAVRYAMEVGAGAYVGDGVNRAQASAFAPSGVMIRSSIASAKLSLGRGGILGDDAYIAGSVYARAKSCLDNDEKPVDKKIPIPGVRFFLDDGSYVVSDKDGEYSLYGVEPGNYAFGADRNTIPRGALFVALEHAHAGDGRSRFVSLNAGEFAREDFVMEVECQGLPGFLNELQRRKEWAEKNPHETPDGYVGMLGIAGSGRDIYTTEGADGDISSGLISGREVTNFSDTSTLATEEYSPPEPPTIDEATKTASRSLARKGKWMWPADNVNRDGRFMALITSAISEPKLFVNDVEQPNEKLGEMAVDQEKRAQILSWYGIELREGANQVEIRGQDNFGNMRTLLQQSFFRPGKLHKIVVNAGKEIIGNKGVAPIGIELVDSSGTRISGSEIITLHATKGEWHESDADPDSPAMQIIVKNGLGLVHLRSGANTQLANVKILTGDGIEKDVEVRFQQADMQLMMIGSANAGLSVPVSPDVEATPALSPMLAQERTALFLKGKLRGDMLLTLSFDSTRGKDSKLMRDNDYNSYYPLYGDSSTRGYEGQARSPLYLKLERGQSSLLWGDFTTDHASDFQLGKLQRKLTGAKGTLHDGGSTISGFAALSENKTNSIEIRGRGTSFGYQIADSSIAHSSEQISLITRSLTNPGLTLSVQKLARLQDYSINYVTGIVDFVEPVPSIDHMGNPISIHATYDYLENSKEYAVAGARYDQELDERSRFGAAYSVSRDQVDGFENLSLFGAADFFDGMLKTEVEFAGSHTLDQEVWGNAVRSTAHLQATDNVTLRTIFAQADRAFKAEGSSIVPGNQEYVGEVIWHMWQGTDMRLLLEYSDVMASMDLDWKSEASIRSKQDSWSFDTSVGHLRERDSTGENQQVYLRERIERSIGLLGMSGSIYGEIANDAEDWENRFYRAGGNLKLAKHLKLSMSHEVVDGLALGSAADDNSHTILGVESDYLPDTQVYSEYAIGENAITGFRSHFGLTTGINILPSAEITISPDGSAHNEYAASIGISRLGKLGWRQSLRLEGRKSFSGESMAASVGLVMPLDKELSLFSNARMTINDQETADDSYSYSGMLGAAWRPAKSDYTSLIYYQAKQEHEGDTGNFAHIFSNHNNLRIEDFLDISGRVGLKLREDWFDGFSNSSSAQIADLKLEVPLEEKKRVGLVLNGGLLTTGWGESISHSQGAGLSMTPTKNMRVEIGFRWRGFVDEDLDQQNFNRSGVYTQFSVKFDESVLGFLDSVFPELAP